MLDSTEWEVWMQLRDRMAHRSNLPRIIKGVMGGPAPTANALEIAATTSSPALSKGPGELSGLFEWLAATLASLLQASVAAKNV
jgi:hypothetical protein